MTDEELFHELLFYTLSHPDPYFIHQNVVDAFAVQHATTASTPITVVFGLIGLYLTLEKGFTGKQVQKAHMQLVRRRKSWPILPLPQDRGSIAIAAVLACPAGPLRDARIREWCASVWQDVAITRDQISALAEQELDVPALPL